MGLYHSKEDWIRFSDSKDVLQFLRHFNIRDVSKLWKSLNQYFDKRNKKNVNDHKIHIPFVHANSDGRLDWPYFFKLIADIEEDHAYEERLMKRKQWNPICYGYAMIKEIKLQIESRSQSKKDEEIDHLFKYFTDDSATESSSEEDSEPEADSDDAKEDEEQIVQEQKVNVETIEVERELNFGEDKKDNDKQMEKIEENREQEPVEKQQKNIFDCSVISPVFFGYCFLKESEEKNLLKEQKEKDLENFNLFSAKCEKKINELYDKDIRDEENRIEVLHKKKEKILDEPIENQGVLSAIRTANEKKIEEVERKIEDVKKRIEEKEKQRESALDNIKVDKTRPYGTVILRMAQSQIETLKQALEQANRELETSSTAFRAASRAKSKSALLYAEKTLRLNEKQVETAIINLKEGELFLSIARKQILVEERYHPIFLFLQDKNELISYIDLTLCFILACNCDLQRKVKFVYNQFSSIIICLEKANEKRRKCNTKFFFHKTKVKGEKVDSFLSFSQLFFLLETYFSLIHRLSSQQREKEVLCEIQEESEYICQKAFRDQNLSSSQTMCFSEFSRFISNMLKKSEILCKLLLLPWEYTSLSRYQREQMPLAKQIKSGLITALDAKYFISKQLLVYYPQLANEAKTRLHERALSKGQDDPLKPTYLQYKTASSRSLHTSSSSRIIPLECGAYKNILYHYEEKRNTAATILQSVFRGRKARNRAIQLARKQAFYHSKALALTKAKKKVQKEWGKKDLLNGVNKIKYDAQIRMRQMRIRTSVGKNLLKDEVKELMIEEDMQQAINEVLLRFKELEIKYGYAKDEDYHQNKDFDASKIQEQPPEDIAKSIVEEIEKAKQFKPKVDRNHEKEILVNQPINDCTTNLLYQRRKSLITGDFLQGKCDLTCLTLEEIEFEEEVCNPEPSKDLLLSRLQILSEGITTLKGKEMLSELPTKRILFSYIKRFMDKGQNIDITKLSKHLREHFRFTHHTDQIAFSLIYWMKSDFEEGILQKSITEIMKKIDEGFYLTLTKEEEDKVNDLQAEKYRKRKEKKFLAKYGQLPANERKQKIEEKEQEEVENKKSELENAFQNLLEAKESLKTSILAYEEAKLRQKQLIGVPSRNKSISIDPIKEIKQDKKSQLQKPELHLDEVNFHTEKEAVLPHEQDKSARERLQWIKRFNYAMQLPQNSLKDLEVKYNELHNISSEFLVIAEEVGVQIISEFYLPSYEKTILPLYQQTNKERDNQSILGEHQEPKIQCKYMVHNILFKVIFDSHGIFDGNDVYAFKAAGNEVKASLAYSCFASSEVIIPFQALIDFHGFRVLATAVVPIDIIEVTEQGEISKISQDHVYGSINHGVNIVNRSPLLHELLLEISQKHLNLALHQVKGTHDLTSKTLASAGNLQGFVGSDKRFYLLHLSDALPPESPLATKHLSSSTRGNTIFWRKMRSEFLKTNPSPLSPDAFSLLTDKTNDSDLQMKLVTEATNRLLTKVLCSFAEQLCSWSSESLKELNISSEMHRRGINLRHLGLLRNKFFCQLEGKVTVIYNTRKMITSNDLTLQLDRGSKVFIRDKTYHVSKKIEDEFNSKVITLEETVTEIAIRNEIAFTGEVSQKKNSKELRDLLLAEMIARAVKRIIRFYLRRALLDRKISSTILVKQILLEVLHRVTGCSLESEAFWTKEIFLSIRQSYGDCSLSSVEKKNYQSLIMENFSLIYIMRRLEEFIGFKLTPNCWKEFSQASRLFRFTIEDFVCSSSSLSSSSKLFVKVKHNLYILHFSLGCLLSQEAKQRQSMLFYSEQVVLDEASEYWKLNERDGSIEAINYGLSKSSRNGQYRKNIIYQVEGPIIGRNNELNHAIQLNLEEKAFVEIQEERQQEINVRRSSNATSLSTSSTSNQVVPPSSASVSAFEDLITIEAWALVQGGENTNRIIVSLGQRYSLVALKTNKWGFLANREKTDVVLTGSSIKLNEWDYLLGTFDGRCFNFYVNGILYGTISVSEGVLLAKQGKKQEQEHLRLELKEQNELKKSQLLKTAKKEVEDFINSKKGKQTIHQKTKQLKKQQEIKSLLYSQDTIKEKGKSTETHQNPLSIEKQSAEKSCEILVKEQYFQEIYSTKIEELEKDYTQRQEQLEKQFKEEEEELNNHCSTSNDLLIRIGSSSNKKNKEGRSHFIGRIAHVALYKRCLPRDLINLHFFLGRYIQDSNTRLFSLASSRLSLALDSLPKNVLLLEKYADNLCDSIKLSYDHKGRKADDIKNYIAKVTESIRYFEETSNCEGLVQIIKNIHKSDMYAYLFAKAFNSIYRLQPTYFTTCTSLSLQELGQYPIDFNLYHVEASIEEQEAAVRITQLIVERYPYYYGDKTIDLSWLSRIKSIRVIIYFIDLVQTKETTQLINLSSCYDMSQSDLNIIFDSNSNMLELNLSNSKALNDISGYALAFSCRHLRALDLTNCSLITDLTLEAISNSCKELVSISLERCFLATDKGREAIINRCKKLQTINLSHCETVSNNFIYLIGTKCNFLVKLALAYCHQITSEGLDAFSRQVNASTFRSLDLTGCRRINDFGLQQLSTFCIKLVELKLSYCHNLTEKGTTFLVHKCFDLEILELQDVDLLTDKMFFFDLEGDGRTVAQKSMIRKLKTLNLSGCSKITDNGIQGLMQKASSSLHTLNVSGCISLTDSAVKSITCPSLSSQEIQEQRIKENKRNESNFHLQDQHLACLDLSYCVLLTNLSINYLSDYCRNIRALHLSGCTQVTEDAICHLIKNCIKIQSLGIGFISNITDDTIKELTKYLWLEELILTHCSSVSNKGLEEIAKEFTGLRILNLAWCRKITNDGLIELVKDCKHLKHLNISNCGLLTEDCLTYLNHIERVEHSWKIEDKIVKSPSFVPTVSTRELQQRRKNAVFAEKGKRKGETYSNNEEQDLNSNSATTNNITKLPLIT